MSPVTRALSFVRIKNTDLYEKEVYRMKTNIKDIRKILKTKKCERTILEQVTLDDWLWDIAAPLRIIIFPVKFIIKLYKWTYNN